MMFEMHKKLISHSSFFEGNKRVLFKTRQKVLHHSYETKKIMKITQALVALRITWAKSILKCLSPSWMEGWTCRNIASFRTDQISQQIDIITSIKKGRGSWFMKEAISWKGSSSWGMTNPRLPQQATGNGHSRKRWRDFLLWTNYKAHNCNPPKSYFSFSVDSLCRGPLGISYG